MIAAFTAKALYEYNEDVRNTMRAIAKRAKIGITNEGIDSIAYSIAQQGNGAVSKMSFKEYLRMVDMGAGRGHPLGGLKSTSVELQSRNKRGLSLVKDNTRKPKTFLYSKTAFGKLNFLTNKLLYGYTEEAIDALKNELTKNIS